MPTSAQHLLIILLPGLANAVCQDDWDSLSCSYFSTTYESFCDPQGLWGHIAVQCQATCQLCRSGGDAEEQLSYNDDAIASECKDAGNSASCVGAKLGYPDFCDTNGPHGQVAVAHCAKTCGLCKDDGLQRRRPSFVPTQLVTSRPATVVPTPYYVKSSAIAPENTWIAEPRKEESLATFHPQQPTMQSVENSTKKLSIDENFLDGMVVSPCSRCPHTHRCVFENCVLDVQCPAVSRYGKGPPAKCEDQPTDPQDKPRSSIESWLTKEVFYDLFPKANLGWGPHECWPYSYEAFVIAVRYFPRFGAEAPDNGYSAEENHRRDLAAFFAHAIQETGENNGHLYTSMSKEEADACFYRGGFFNWFEGGPGSGFLAPDVPGHYPNESSLCRDAGRYCDDRPDITFFYPCNNRSYGELYEGCYFGRGAIQLSYNYNYGAFQLWLHSQGIDVDILADPGLLMTKMDPPLSVMASVWFYMTPQPPKPAMHDIVMGKWRSGPANVAAGYTGPIFGPTSLIINNECHGESPEDPGPAGESRRIKAFRWFCDYFGVPVGEDRLLSCKEMVTAFDELRHPQSFGPDWSRSWRNGEPCDCVPQHYAGLLPYYDPEFYPEEFEDLNEINRKLCIVSIYDRPDLYHMDKSSAPCLLVPPIDV